LVFVLNKIGACILYYILTLDNSKNTFSADLVPKDNAQAWLRHLRHSTPTLPFRSATNAQRSNLSSTTAPALLRLLKAYKPSAAQSVTVGVVGYPNVGKSSLINSLKRAKVCAVAAQPGHTKDLKSVQLERGIKIVDSPGVVFDEDDSAGGAGTAKGNVLLRNVVKVEDIDDPIAVVEEIVERTERETLQKIYRLPEFSSTLEFLGMLALTTGRLLKVSSAYSPARYMRLITIHISRVALQTSFRAQGRSCKTGINRKSLISLSLHPCILPRFRKRHQHPELRTLAKLRSSQRSAHRSNYLVSLAPRMQELSRTTRQCRKESSWRALIPRSRWMM
jgi:hypothetical protein